MHSLGPVSSQHGDDLGFGWVGFRILYGCVVMAEVCVYEVVCLRCAFVVMAEVGVCV